MLRLLAVVTVAVCLGLFAVPANAALLGLTPEHYPLVYSGDVNIDYSVNGNIGLLNATGTSYSFYAGSGGGTDIWGDFVLTATINPATGQAAGASLMVSGDTGTMFYSNTLTAFGSGQDDRMEFSFIQQGTMVAPDHEPLGVILFGVSTPGLEPDFSHSFTNNGNGYSDTFYMPEPATMALLAVAGLGLLRRRAR